MTVYIAGQCRGGRGIAELTMSVFACVAPKLVNELSGRSRRSVESEDKGEKGERRTTRSI